MRSRTWRHPRTTIVASVTLVGALVVANEPRPAAAAISATSIAYR